MLNTENSNSPLCVLSSGLQFCLCFPLFNCLVKFMESPKHICFLSHQREKNKWNTVITGKNNNYIHFYRSSGTVFRAVLLHEVHRGFLDQLAEHSTKALARALPAQDETPTLLSEALFWAAAFSSAATSGNALTSEPLTAITQLGLAGLCSNSCRFLSSQPAFLYFAAPLHPRQ